MPLVLVDLPGGTNRIYPFVLEMPTMYCSNLSPFIYNPIQAVVGGLEAVFPFLSFDSIEVTPGARQIAICFKIFASGIAFAASGYWARLDHY